MDYSIGTRVLDDWTIMRLIGEGGYGRVYEVEKTSHGVTTKSALKVIKIPQNPTELQTIVSEGLSAERYFHNMVDDIYREIAIMASVKDHPNIVSCEDHAVVEYPEDIRWDILIRMQLLTPLTRYQIEHPLTVTDVVRLGLDISAALSHCHAINLIHRDVKPENIFVSSVGQFKLGDFGVARTMERSSHAQSVIGTESYMAPEVYQGQPYDFQADIYSLGLVLYRLLNNNRMPFLPQPPQEIKLKDREQAFTRRIGGEALPSPVNADATFSAIVLRACAHQTSDRYATAEELHAALQSYVPGDTQRSTSRRRRYRSAEDQAAAEPSFSRSQAISSGHALESTSSHSQEPSSIRALEPSVSRSLDHASAAPQPAVLASEQTVSRATMRRYRSEASAQPPAPANRSDRCAPTTLTSGVIPRDHSAPTPKRPKSKAPWIALALLLVATTLSLVYLNADRLFLTWGLTPEERASIPYLQWSEVE